jgi:NAD-dependent dihydropyrimidine dehydrogenase PreA subunit
MIITTDAIVTYDQPLDYGIHKFCEICQVCVNRCPGRALIRDKVWWRGVQKHKLVYDRCRPVMARYTGCGVCMKVCPVQKYGMKPVMEHYVETGEVLGKGTHELEGYSIEEKGYFGPGELPHFNHDFFEIPHGRSEDVLFKEFKAKLNNHEIPDGPAGDEALREFKKEVEEIVAKPVDDAMALLPQKEQTAM